MENNISPNDKQTQDCGKENEILFQKPNAGGIE